MRRIRLAASSKRAAIAFRLAQSLARGITKVGDVATEMVDVCSADPQELAAAERRRASPGK